MKVVNKLLSKAIPTDVVKTQRTLFSAVKEGWSVGKRYSEINNKGLMTDMFIRGKAIKRNIKLTKEDIPACTAIATSFVPVPCSTFAGYGVGKVLKFLLNIIVKGHK